MDNTYLDINEDDYKRVKNKTAIVLVGENGLAKAVLENIEIFKYNKEDYARKVFGTTDVNHPGVAEIMVKGNYLVGGDIIDLKEDEKFFLNTIFCLMKQKKYLNKEDGILLWLFKLETCRTAAMSICRKKL